MAGLRFLIHAAVATRGELAQGIYVEGFTGSCIEQSQRVYGLRGAAVGYSLYVRITSTRGRLANFLSVRSSARSRLRICAGMIDWTKC